MSDYQWESTPAVAQTRRRTVGNVLVTEMSDGRRFLSWKCAMDDEWIVLNLCVADDAAADVAAERLNSTLPAYIAGIVAVESPSIGEQLAAAVNPGIAARLATGEHP